MTAAVSAARPHRHHIRGTRWLPLFAILAASMLTGVTLGATPAHATGVTLYVAPVGLQDDDCSDPGDACYLSSAVEQANADTDDTLVLADGTYTNADAHLTLTAAMTLTAATGAHPVIDGGGTGDVITVASSGDATLHGLTLTNAGDQSSEIYNNLGAVDVQASSLIGGGFGVFAAGRSTIRRSLIRNAGQGVHAELDAVTIADSTIDGNGTGVFGSTNFTLTGSTVTDNNVGLNISNGSDVVGDDIVAGSTTDGCERVGGEVMDGGFFIDSGNSCLADGIGGGPGSVSGAGSELIDSIEPLADNGGPTETRALRPSSPAIDLVTGRLSDGTLICGTPDQRGARRPGGTCDAGAYESMPTLLGPQVDLSVSPLGGAAAGDKVTLTADVSGRTAEPTGTVDFTVGGASIGGCESVPLATDGTAQCQTSDLGKGTYWLAAHYSGDMTYGRGSDVIGGYPVTKSAPVVELRTFPVGGSSLGKLVTLTALVTGEAGDPGGSVRFTDNGSTLKGCVAVAVAADNTAQCQTSALRPGTYDLRAHYSGELLYTAGMDEIPSYVVDRAASTVAVAVHTHALVATVTPAAPATSTPTGQVTFTVDGIPVGTAALTGGTATLGYTPSGAHGIGAQYTGDDNYQPSVGSTATRNPKLTAKLTSTAAKTGYGWYRTPVTATFTCTAGSGTLLNPCPSPVQLTANKAGQSVTRTIHADDGGIATVTVGPINIDQLPPTVSVDPNVDGGSYPTQQTLTCTGTDTLSGIATCTVTQTLDNVHHVEHFTATAKDRAGNITTIHGSYTITG
jgi:hypothetical protein